MNKVTFNIASQNKAKHHSTSAEEILLHFYRVNKQLSINIIHRIGFLSDINQSACNCNNSKNRKNIKLFFIAVNLLLNSTNNCNQNDRFYKADKNILRCMYAQKVSRKTCKGNHYTAENCKPLSFFPLPDKKTSVHSSCAHSMSAWKRITGSRNL